MENPIINLFKREGIIKKISVLLVLCLVIPSFLLGQTPTAKPGEAEGNKLGTIISTVIGIALPPLQPLIKLIFPNPESKDSDTVKISKKELQDKLDKVKSDMQRDMKVTLEPIARITLEVGVLGSVLKPCIEVQDYLREINVLIARSEIQEADWSRVRNIWPLIKQRTKYLAENKACDVNPIRNRNVKEDLTKIIDIGKGAKLERLELDYINLPITEINNGDKATLLRIEISNLLELYQTVQMILVLSLQDLQSDFFGAQLALSGQAESTAKKFATDYGKSKSVDNRILWTKSDQELIVDRLNNIIEKLDRAPEIIN